MTKTFETIRDDLNAFIGGTPHGRDAKIPAHDADLDHIDPADLFPGVVDRESYLAWVARYKALVNCAAEQIRAQKALRRHADDNVRDRAQWQQTQLSAAVTLAIRLRRLGKRWSATEARRLASVA